MAGKGAFGIKLVYLGTSAVTSFVSSNGTAVGQITAASGPELSKETIDVSDMDSSTRFKEFVGGMIDAGNFTVELNYSPTITTNLVSYATATANACWGIYLPAQGGTASGWAAMGLVDKLGHPSADTGGKLNQSMSIKISGVPTHYTSAT